MYQQGKAINILSGSLWVATEFLIKNTGNN